MPVQTKKELEKFYTKEDPWGYETNEEDQNRLAALKSVLDRISTEQEINTILDIGCGHGFVTRELTGRTVIGVDLSEKAIKHAIKNNKKNTHSYMNKDMYGLTLDSLAVKDPFDMIIITGVVYPQYIGKSDKSLYCILDPLLKTGGVLVSVQVGEWYNSRFPYTLLHTTSYPYRHYEHILEVYKK